MAAPPIDTAVLAEAEALLHRAADLLASQASNTGNTRLRVASTIAGNLSLLVFGEIEEDIAFTASVTRERAREIAHEQGRAKRAALHAEVARLEALPFERGEYEIPRK